MKEEEITEKYVGLDGYLNPDGLKILASFLKYLPEIHRGKWREAYVPLISRLVMVCNDVAIVRNNGGNREVLLKWREDKHYTGGWEAPGGGQGPRESYEESAKRHAREEFGMGVRFIREVKNYDFVDNRRAHDHTVLLLCEPLDEPRNDVECQWFSVCPPNMVART